MTRALHSIWTVLAAGAIAWSAIGSVHEAHAQADNERIVTNPPKLQLRRQPLPAAPTISAATRLGAAGKQRETTEANLELKVVKTLGKLWNPAAQRFDQVSLRSYQGDQVDPNNPFISPMLEVKPGDTLRISLNNQLEKEESCTQHPADINTPHCANGTNLHTHGLWVNPAGNSDNVLISVNPGVKFMYEYHIPSDHPAGTFWYHTHLHGSTALQVSSGMAGALIVRGNTVPTDAYNGDLDTLFKPIKLQPFNERILVLQQIQYACRDAAGKIKQDSTGAYQCDPNETGSIELGKPVAYDQFGPATWENSGRYTSINGQVLPFFDGARAGQIERWRMIHGGVRDSINLQFRKMKAGADLHLALRASDNDAFIAANCTGDALPQHLIAADGLTAAAVIKTDTTIFQPGYRWDDLVVFPEPGNYCVYDAPISRTGNVSQLAESRRLLGVVRVAPGFPVRDTTAFVTAELTRAAATNMPESIRGKVIADLKDGLKLSHFTPHPRVDPSEVRGKRDITFDIAPPAGPAGGPQFHINGQSFLPGRIDQTLELGSVEEWTLKSNVIGHPFHIHVNPFQIVAILDPDGKDVSGPDAQDGPDGAVDPQYRGLKGVWKDTIFVKNGTPFPAPPGSSSKPYTVVVRTRYERYIGDFVLHCHILDHEDQGMMQLVRVALPDGVGGIAQAHHAAPPSAAPKKPQTSQAPLPRAANQLTRANAPVRP